jgi:RNA polymerase sigma factor (sigma-70 family)
VDNPSEVNKFVDHLFRHESGRLISALTRIFGSSNIELAEDAVQESLVEAIKNWTYKGIPDNPAGWLYQVAKNKALNIITKEQFNRQHASDVIHFFQSGWTVQPAMELFFSEKEIMDDQLRMIFTCCHPSISPDSQVALALKTLCGFNMAEIAAAFLTSEENIHKRLVRARKKIRDEKIPFDVPGAEELGPRLKAALDTIFLLFNEGYKASHGNDLIRSELAEEAMRLTEILVAHPAITDKSAAHALLALMQLNTSRFGARNDAEGNIITLDHQDRSLWDLNLIEKGCIHLQKSEPENHLSKFHCLAVISAHHCRAPSFEETDWAGILNEYNRLMQIDNSPVVQLNRSIALGKAQGPAIAIECLKQIEDSGVLKEYHLFYSVKADFLMKLEQFDAAEENLIKARQFASLENEKSLLDKRIEFCRQKIR